MAERSKAAGCKPVSNTRVGSNPTFLNLFREIFPAKTINLKFWKRNLRKKVQWAGTRIFYLRKQPKHLLRRSAKPFVHLSNIYFYTFKYYLNTRTIRKNSPILSTFFSGLHSRFTYYKNIFPSRKIPNKSRKRSYMYERSYNSFYKSDYLFALSFQRNRFFPYVSSYSGWTHITTSLGIFAKFLKKRKSFLKTKPVYMIVANFLRKVLLFSKIPSFHFLTKKVPKYYQEILSTLFNPVPNLYSSPFSKATVYEDSVGQPFYFTYILYFNNKSYTTMKDKQKGRLKRKIQKKINAINRVLD